MDGAVHARIAVGGHQRHARLRELREDDADVLDCRRSRPGDRRRGAAGVRLPGLRGHVRFRRRHQVRRRLGSGLAPRAPVLLRRQRLRHVRGDGDAPWIPFPSCGTPAGGPPLCRRRAGAAHARVRVLRIARRLPRADGGRRVRGVSLRADPAAVARLGDRPGGRRPARRGERSVLAADGDDSVGCGLQPHGGNRPASDLEPRRRLHAGSPGARGGSRQLPRRRGHLIAIRRTPAIRRGGAVERGPQQLRAGRRGARHSGAGALPRDDPERFSRASLVVPDGHSVIRPCSGAHAGVDGIAHRLRRRRLLPVARLLGNAVHAARAGRRHAKGHGIIRGSRRGRSRSRARRSTWTALEACRNGSTART